MTEEEIEAAYEAEYTALGQLITKFSEHAADELDGLEIEVDDGALWNLAQSYVDDVNRYTAYHNAPIPDHARRCAYFCKWLMKLRPLVVRNPSAPPGEELESSALMANEIFGAWCASNRMGIEWAEDLSQQMQDLFLYTLRHRLSSEDTYILFFAQICHL